MHWTQLKTRILNCATILTTWDGDHQVNDKENTQDNNEFTNKKLISNSGGNSKSRLEEKIITWQGDIVEIS